MRSLLYIVSITDISLITKPQYEESSFERIIGDATKFSRRNANIKIIQLHYKDYFTPSIAIRYQWSSGSQTFDHGDPKWRFPAI